MQLINCEINLIIIWSENCVISEVNRVTIFALTNIKLYVSSVTFNFINSR